MQLKGSDGPGGGFQAGMIFASLLVVAELQMCREILTLPTTLLLGVCGVLIYFVVGLGGLLFGGAYMDYSFITVDSAKAHRIGISIVEIGVGLCVSACGYGLYRVTSK